MSARLPTRAGRHRRPRKTPASRFKRQHSAELALQTPLAKRRPLSAHRPAAGSRRGRGTNHVLVSGPAKTPLAMAAAKLRLDELLVARGLAPTRAQAKALIMSGRVLRGTERLDKPGKEFPEDVALSVEQPPRFVSRG